MNGNHITGQGHLFPTESAVPRGDIRRAVSRLAPEDTISLNAVASSLGWRLTTPLDDQTATQSRWRPSVHSTSAAVAVEPSPPARRPLPFVLEKIDDRKRNFFISWDSSDEVLVDRLCGYLRSCGFQIWNQKRELSLKSPLDANLLGAITCSDATLFFIGRNSVTPARAQELTVAMAYGHFVPIFLPGCDIETLPQSVRRRRSIDLRGAHESQSQSEWEEMLQELIDARGRLQARQTALGQRPAWLAAAEWPVTEKVSAAYELPMPPLFKPEITRALLTLTAAVAAPTGPVDASLVVQAIVKQRPLARLPRQLSPSLSLGLHLLLEASQAMLPFTRDVRTLASQLLHIVGHDRLQVGWFATHPWNGLLNRLPGLQHPWEPPPPSVPVLVVASMGLFGGEHRENDHSRWVELANYLARRGSTFTALVPLPRERLPPDLARAIRIVSWDRPTSVRAVARPRSLARSSI